MPSKENLRKVEEIRKWFDESESIIVIHYKGLRVAEASELRGKVKETGARLRVLKNTLTRIALKGTDKEPAISLVEGPIAVAFTNEDPASCAMVIREFARGRKEIYFRGGMIGSRVLGAQEMEALAVLPPRDVLIARAVGQAAGVLSSFVGVCSGVLRDFMGVLNAIARRKGEEATA